MEEVLTYREQNIEYKGKRIRCIHMEDKFPVPDGTEGTVTSVDDVGTIHVKWDNGSTLGLVQGVDRYQFV